MALQNNKMASDIQGQGIISSFNRFADTEEGVAQRQADKQEFPELFGFGNEEDETSECEREMEDSVEKEAQIEEEEDPTQIIALAEMKELRNVKEKRDKIEDLDLSQF